LRREKEKKEQLPPLRELGKKKKKEAMFLAMGKKGGQEGRRFFVKGKRSWSVSASEEKN